MTGSSGLNRYGTSPTSISNKWPRLIRRPQRFWSLACHQGLLTIPNLQKFESQVHFKILKMANSVTYKLDLLWHCCIATIFTPEIRHLWTLAINILLVTHLALLESKPAYLVKVILNLKKRVGGVSYRVVGVVQSNSPCTQTQLKPQDEGHDWGETQNSQSKLHFPEHFSLQTPQTT